MSSNFKISGQERRDLKKLLNEYKAYEKGFWHYHQLDKDMCNFISPEKLGEYPMKSNMKTELYSVVDQIYLIPTIKTTYSRTLNGYYSIDLVWLRWGVTLMC